MPPPGLSRDRMRRRVLVPTMGALHRGHGELIRIAREAAGPDGEVAVSIFVNPLQFAPGGDYEKYPRPEEADEEFCRNAGVDMLFRPSVEEMYAADFSISVEENALANTLCGRSRPGHFRGVCTVVTKLFHLARARRRGFRREGFSTTRDHPPNGAGPEFPDRDHRGADGARIGWTGLQFAQSIFERRGTSSRRRCCSAPCRRRDV